jgi:hypothetical protein
MLFLTPRALSHWPVILVADTERLHGAIEQEAVVVLPGVRAPQVHRPDVHRRMAIDDPARHDVPDPATGEDAERVEAGGDEEVPEVGRLPHQVIVVGRERLGAAEQQLDALVEQAGHAAHRVLDVRVHPVPVGRDVAEAEILGDAFRGPRPCRALEQAHHELAGLLADVGRAARIAQDRQLRVHALDRFRDQVVVLGRLQRHVDAGQPPDRACPHPGAVNHVLGLDLAARSGDARDPAACAQDPRDWGVLEDPHAALPRAPGERLRNVGRVDARVVREIEGCDQVTDIRQRPEGLHLGGADLVGLDPEARRHVETAAHFLGLVGRHRELDRTAVNQPRGLSGLRLELSIEILRVLREPGLRLGVAQRGQQARGVPGRA